MVADLGADPGMASDYLAREFGMSSFPGYPVRVRGRTVGCLFVYDTPPRKYHPLEVETLGVFSRILAAEETHLAHERASRAWWTWRPTSSATR
ncbi:MAG: GAF domain-containing protein [Actinomycetota bacterium]